ncbi:hypothetical protein SDRG_11068 [Saprolegnia diclina VS20]|uniref:Uncharacterized protein n=1 Tax=Saprolegnia diclina (strain VS20) TaxID=1156394 RepID=T0QA21_SAPDV|nr:hypothetical protein SDRG_11068 [Saprolegnia diclina VS20]EQC31471.1 hypothetical protein SDRG_11068 [Saprolegnia diclina VS20]|eukprot:XP_008615312.1 hypothetical protein SDRG_11068 [Saprolegnia diclina VS20]
MKTIAILASLTIAAAATISDCTSSNLAGLTALGTNATSPFPLCAKAININAAKLANPSWQPDDLSVLDAFYKAPALKTYSQHLVTLSCDDYVAAAKVGYAA